MQSVYDRLHSDINKAQASFKKIYVFDRLVWLKKSVFDRLEFLDQDARRRSWRFHQGTNFEFPHVLPLEGAIIQESVIHAATSSLENTAVKILECTRSLGVGHQVVNCVNLIRCRSYLTMDMLLNPA